MANPGVSIDVRLEDIVWAKSAGRKLINAQQVRDKLADAAARVADRANDAALGGAEYSSTPALKDKSRVGAHAFAHTNNYAAMVDNAKNNTLLKSI